MKKLQIRKMILDVCNYSRNHQRDFRKDDFKHGRLMNVNSKKDFFCTQKENSKERAEPINDQNSPSWDRSVL